MHDEAFPIRWCPLLDPVIHRWIYTYHYASGVR